MSYTDFQAGFLKAEDHTQGQPEQKSAASIVRSRTDCKIKVWTCWNERAAQFARHMEGQGSTLFQSAAWLEIWYETFLTDPQFEAVIVGVEEQETGKLLMLLPLFRHRQNGLDTISFADFGLADYNAPLVDPDFNPDKNEATQIMKDIYSALPPADLLRLEKLPEQINNQKNPLLAMVPAQTSNLNHYGVEISGSWEDYWNGLKRSFRKDQRRRWRVLEKKGAVSFKICNNQKDALALFETLQNQQRARLSGLGLPYLLDNPRMQAFYARLIEQGCHNGQTVFSALLVDGQPVATLCGLGNGRSYAMTLSGYETGEWSKSSPGRLLTERTMQHLHEQGYSHFDFTIGDEPYKSCFAKRQGTLHEFSHPLSLKALPHHGWLKLKGLQRRSKWLRQLKNTLRSTRG